MDLYILLNVATVKKLKGMGPMSVRGTMDSSITKIKKKNRNQLDSDFERRLSVWFERSCWDDHRKEKIGLAEVNFPFLSTTHPRTRVIKYNYANKNFKSCFFK